MSGILSIKRMHGANVILLREDGEILCVKGAYKTSTGRFEWMLPGGAVERGESPKHAARSETAEETGLLIREADLRLMALFDQLVIRDGRPVEAPRAINGNNRFPRSSP